MKALLGLLDVGGSPVDSYCASQAAAQPYRQPEVMQAAEVGIAL
jgi:hypothetical protein